VLELVLGQREQPGEKEHQIGVGEQAPSPGMSCFLNAASCPFFGYTGSVGSTRPSSLTPNNTKQSKPCRSDKIFAIIGIDCSLRYS